MLAREIPHHPCEPAHPMMVRVHEGLTRFYELLKEKYQVEIDGAFDRAARQIGYVVRTAIPVAIEPARDGSIGRIGMAAKYLEGTLFARELAPVLEKMIKEHVPIFRETEGPVLAYLFWHEALKLQIGASALNAGVSARGSASAVRAATELTAQMARIPEELQPGGPWTEPAHWFDPGQLIVAEEAIIITVIDRVYEDLRLIQTISAVRQRLAGAGPGAIGLMPEPIPGPGM